MRSAVGSNRTTRESPGLKDLRRTQMQITISCCSTGVIDPSFKGLRMQVLIRAIRFNIATSYVSCIIPASSGRKDYKPVHLVVMGQGV